MHVVFFFFIFRIGRKAFQNRVADALSQKSHGARELGVLYPSDQLGNLAIGNGGGNNITTNNSRLQGEVTEAFGILFGGW